MKTTIVMINKALALLFALLLFVSYSCHSNDDDNNGHFTYIGTIDPSCGYTIHIEKESTSEFIKPTNLDSSFEKNSLKVEVTFSYLGEQQMHCGGFVGHPEKVKIIKIKKL